jgi:glycosyltransferase involved in cell wall biosynthesis
MYKKIKISVIIAVLDSHKVVVRQIRHFKKMRLPNSVEIIFVDDGSDPPLSYENCGLRNFSIYATNDKRPWTQGLARNLGASKAKGEYLLFTDIDHIITKEAVMDLLEFDGAKMVFPRYYGILDRYGNIICDEKSMIDFGLNPIRLRRRGLSCGFHGNTYGIKKTIFDAIGGYDSRYCTQRFHMGGTTMSEERKFNINWSRLVKRGSIIGGEKQGSKIYHFPVSKFRLDGNNNPFGLFHRLSLEQVPQPDKGDWK